MRHWQYRPPFALFVTAIDISLELLNQKLALIYSDVDAYPGAFYVVQGNEYPTEPELVDGRMPDPPGTNPPVAEFTSLFAGKSIQDCADWLEHSPEWAYLERKDFAVLDEYSAVNDTVTICRRNPQDYYDHEIFLGEDEYGDVQYYPCPTENFNTYFMGGVEVYFDDNLDTYQSKQRSSGEPDLSQGRAYWRIEEREQEIKQRGPLYLPAEGEEQWIDRPE